jgi:MPBQ/MSBQ methyltransferase
VDIAELVRAHYGGADLATAVLRALADAGTDIDALTVEDLAPIDELHAGGAAATRYLLEQLRLGPGSRLLDVGSGIGGPSRLAAAYAGAVTGVDLTPDFVTAATELTRRVGLAERVTFRLGTGDGLPFDDASCDAAMLIHVGMNVPDKPALFAEVHRVLAPGGRFGVYEQMRLADGALPYPMPWASDERYSFVQSPADYEQQLTAAGFTIERTENRSAAVPPSSAARPDLGPQVIFGPAFARCIANNVAATQAGQLGAVFMVARAG